jgi:hypothetical protein
MPTWKTLVFDDIFAAPLVSAATPLATPVFPHVSERRSFESDDEPWKLMDFPVSPAQRSIAMRVVKSFLEQSFKSQDLSNQAAQSGILKEKMSGDVHMGLRQILVQWPLRSVGEEDLVSVV